MNRYKQTIYFMMLLLIYLSVSEFIIPIILSMLKLVGIYFEDKSYLIVFILFITPIICSLIPMILYFKVTKESVIKTIKIKKISMKNFLLILLMSFLIQPILNFIALITSFIFPNNVSNTMSSLSSIPFLIFLFVSAILPAIFEEFVFRGIILSGCRSTGILKSSLLSGLFFGIMHLDPHQFIYAFFAGTIFSLFVLYTDSIFASITSHFIINGTQGLFVFISSRLLENTPNQSIEEISSEYSYKLILNEVISIGLTAVIFTILFFLIFKYFIKINKNNIAPLPSSEMPQEKIITIPFIITIIIFLTYIIFTNI